MIEVGFVILTPQGLYCQAGDFYLDPQKPVQTAVISHAHADHATSGNETVFATAPTLAFMELRYGKNAGKKKQLVSYQQKFMLKEVEIKFLPAGHMLGSAQILMCYKGVKYLYTGDIKLQTDTTCEPVEFIKADVLITETTFANPQIAHPPAETEILKLNASKVNIMLGAYALGKSQRLISLISKFCPGKKVLVHRQIAPISKLYEHFGFLNADYQLYDRKAMKNGINMIYLVPPFTFQSYMRAKDVRRIFASGWKNLQTNEHDSLYISDHADWAELLTLIEEVGPQEIWTLHGNGYPLRDYFAGNKEVRILN